MRNRPLHAVVVRMRGLFGRRLLESPVVIDSGSGWTYVRFPGGDQSFIRY